MLGKNGAKKGAKPAKQPLGRTAFQAHFAKMSQSIVVGQDNPQTREVAHAIARARQWAQSGDYLAAIHAIGALEVWVSRPAGGPRAGAVMGADVEEALGEVRRKVQQVGEADGSVEAARLWQAAREEIVRGSWEAAMALLVEAKQWLAGGK